MSEYRAKVTKSDTTYSVYVASTPPFSGGMEVWHLRDFLRAVDASGIPDDAKVSAASSHDTGHFIGVSVRHTFVVEQADPEPPDPEKAT